MNRSRDRWALAGRVRNYSGSVLLAAAVLAHAGMAGARAQETQEVIALPAPRTEGGKPLLTALKERRSSRGYASRPLPLQLLSDLLWAANGQNRPEGGRTAPSTMKAQEIDIYVFDAAGVYRYEPGRHVLARVLSGDLRAATGIQPFVKQAAVNLVFVCDESRMGRIPDAEREFYAATDTGFISQNVYLFCASEGLATVVRGWVDRTVLAKTLGLKSTQRIVLAQSVGYPAE